MSTGERIKQARKDAGLTQTELAARLGISKQLLYKYETDIVKNIPLDTMKDLARILDVRPSYLADFDDDKTAASTSEPALTAKDERDIAHKLNEVLDQLSGDSALMFDGEPLDDVTRDLLRDSLENQFRTAKVLAKQKYTPKKYRKDE
ncbi:MAG: helix-turn-helix transcriptional regulator [Butyricicoccus sp.]|nr:helix-turn-helix transcriptional regulator [Butyricicoccus sp.]DAH78640.1 MAG TPA: helix-turn-helix domain protein [Caudoviricetes sp.]